MNYFSRVQIPIQNNNFKDEQKIFDYIQLQTNTYDYLISVADKVKTIITLDESYYINFKNNQFSQNLEISLLFTKAQQKQTDQEDISKLFEIFDDNRKNIDEVKQKNIQIIDQLAKEVGELESITLSQKNNSLINFTQLLTRYSKIRSEIFKAIQSFQQRYLNILSDFKNIYNKIGTIILILSDVINDQLKIKFQEYEQILIQTYNELNERMGAIRQIFFKKDFNLQSLNEQKIKMGMDKPFLANDQIMNLQGLYTRYRFQLPTLIGDEKNLQYQIDLNDSELKALQGQLIDLQIQKQQYERDYKQHGFDEKYLQSIQQVYDRPEQAGAIKNTEQIVQLIYQLQMQKKQLRNKIPEVQAQIEKLKSRFEFLQGQNNKLKYDRSDLQVKMSHVLNQIKDIKNGLLIYNIVITDEQ